MAKTRAARRRTNNGWQKYKALVLETQERLEKTLRDIDHKVDRLNETVAALKVKAGIWGALGAVAGAITIMIPVLLWLVLRALNKGLE